MMTSSPLLNTAIYLIKVFFNAYLTIVLLRFIFQMVRADFYNPISQFIVKITNPLLIPIRKIIPGFMGLDLSSLFLLLILQLVELVLLLLIKGATLTLKPLFLAGLTFWGIGELLDLTCSIYLYSIIFFVILSWLPQTGYNPLLILLMQIINPLLIRIQRYIPPIGGLDLSPWFFIIILQVAIFLLVQPLVDYGIQLSFGH